MIDTHCHLDLLESEELNQSINDSSLEYLITIGYNLETSQNAIELSEKYDKVFCAIGFHPHDASSYDIDWLKRKALSHKKVKAIGETGLDFYKNYSPKDVQEESFRKHIRLARELGLPLVVHSREAQEETLKILKEEMAHEVGGVLHCFSGSYEFMMACVDMGFYISFSGILTYPNAKELRSVASKTPTTRIVIETDAPYLPPQPKRGQKNTPRNLIHIAKELANLVPNSNIEDVIRMTSQNAKKLFNLGLERPSNTITYVINNKLYINLTNRCNLHCVFCQREQERDFMVKGHWVWLERDPSSKEVINEIKDPTPYEEVVFCGYGEPTLRFDTLKEVSAWLKSAGAKKVRVDTNGLMLSFLPPERLKELKGLVDVWSVSLNAQDANSYNLVCKPVRSDTFQKVCEFIKEALKNGFEVIATAVDYPGVDIEKTKQLAHSLGAKFRARTYGAIG
ncbi:MAG: YchF/TatD family DNA exonuclease [Aquificaceae bacterium]|nr:YchF/TatD family DNA exonuclease [Aquificaceae bacterium]MDW8237579.1 YchF/TatD family DNA exonuclease [Aquificaceae bacterium]